MKALILGGSGFIGSHIVRALLKEGMEARVLLRPTSSLLALEGLSFEKFFGDLNDLYSLEKALAGCHYLFHAAGYYPIYSFDAERQLGLAKQQMANVLQAAWKTPSLEKIIYTSSLSTIGKAEEGLADENSPYDPKKRSGLYYRIKYELEQQVLATASKGSPITVVNPTAVFGDYDIKPTSGILILMVAKQKIPFLFDAKMNAVDVTDVAQGQLAALRKGKVGERYLLGGYNITLKELVEKIARLTGVKAPARTLPLAFGKTAAWVSEFLGKFILRQKKPWMPRIGIDFLEHGAHYNTRKAQTELGFQTRPLEETLNRALRWFKSQGWL